MELVLGVVVLVVVAYGIFYYWSNRSTGVSDVTVPYKVESKPEPQVSQVVEVKPEAKMAKPKAAKKAKPTLAKQTPTKVGNNVQKVKPASTKPTKVKNLSVVQGKKPKSKS